MPTSSDLNWHSLIWQQIKRIIAHLPNAYIVQPSPEKTCKTTKRSSCDLHLSNTLCPSRCNTLNLLMRVVCESNSFRGAVPSMPNPRGKLQLILDVLAANREPYNPNEWRREPWPARMYETISEYQVWSICFEKVCYISRISGEAEPLSSH